MNTLLVATDFSVAADNAMHYAARLAQKFGAAIKLLHVYAVPVSMNDMPVLVVSAENLKRTADDGIKRLTAELQQQYPQLPVTGESRLGDIRTEIDDLCKAEAPMAIVIGAHGVSGFERVVFGSTATSIIRHAKMPVIAVPDTYHDFKTEKIMMASDLQNNQSIPIDDIKQWVHLLGASLHIVHISPTNNGTNDEGRDLTTRFQELKPAYEVVYSHDMQKGIDNQLKKIGADLLLIMPHQHSLFERIFFRQHTEDLIFHARVPILSICC